MNNFNSKKVLFIFILIFSLVFFSNGVYGADVCINISKSIGHASFTNDFDAEDTASLCTAPGNFKIYVDGGHAANNSGVFAGSASNQLFNCTGTQSPNFKTAVYLSSQGGHISFNTNPFDSTAVVFYCNGSVSGAVSAGEPPVSAKKKFREPCSADTQCDTGLKCVTLESGKKCAYNSTGGSCFDMSNAGLPCANITFVYKTQDKDINHNFLAFCGVKHTTNVNDIYCGGFGGFAKKDLLSTTNALQCMSKNSADISNDFSSSFPDVMELFKKYQSMGIINSMCSMPHDVGASCASGTFCRNGMVCGTNLKCPLGDEDRSCSSDAGCTTGLKCRDNMCTRPNAEPSAPLISVITPTPNYCTNKSFVVNISIGSGFNVDANKVFYRVETSSYRSSWFKMNNLTAVYFNAIFNPATINPLVIFDKITYLHFNITNLNGNVNVSILQKINISNNCATAPPAPPQPPAQPGGTTCTSDLNCPLTTPECRGGNCYARTTCNSNSDCNKPEWGPGYKCDTTQGHNYCIQVCDRDTDCRNYPLAYCNEEIPDSFGNSPDFLGVCSGLGQECPPATCPDGTVCELYRANQKKVCLAEGYSGSCSALGGADCNVNGACLESHMGSTSSNSYCCIPNNATSKPSCIAKQSTFIPSLGGEFYIVKGKCENGQREIKYCKDSVCSDVESTETEPCEAVTRKGSTADVPAFYVSAGVIALFVIIAFYILLHKKNVKKKGKKH